MPAALEQAGAAREPSSFAPLHTDRIFTGFWPNRSVLRDGASTLYMLRYGLGRQDTIWAGSNTEISPFLTLIRRPGSSVFNSATFPPIISYYAFHTFTLTSEHILVLVDTASAVYDATVNGTKTLIFTKSAAAVGQPTYFLGVGNTLYMTNGVDNVQWIYNPSTGTGTMLPWGINAPTTAPTVSQSTRVSSFYTWAASTAYSIQAPSGPLIAIVDGNNNIQEFKGAPSAHVANVGVPNPPSPNGITGTTEPVWKTDGTATLDGTGTTQISWTFGGSANWIANHSYGSYATVAANVTTSSGTTLMLFQNITTGGLYTSAATPPKWPSAVGAKIGDGPNIVWQNIGNALTWAGNLGPSCPIVSAVSILDPNGYIQYVIGAGKTSAGPAPPDFQQTTGAITYDGTAIWQNQGPFAVAASDILQYGYAYENSKNLDISNMSPASLPILVILGNEVTVQGQGTGQAGIDTIPIYRTLQGGGPFYLRTTIPNPGAGNTWTYVDTDITSAAVNQNITAQTVGEGTPLPAGATCLAYHLGRIFAAVGNVVYVSTGPDAVNSGASGNAGFDQFFTLQSKITRFWVSPIGLIVFTVRDSYIFLGSASDTDPLYVQIYIPRLPLLSYNCFDEYMNSGYLYLGTRMMMQLNPGSGVTEASFPVANYLLNTGNNYDPAKCYLTFHTQGSNESAAYLANGTTEWLRMSLSLPPEPGSAWSPPAAITGGTSAVQSVEVTPGVFSLLIGPQTSGPILKRDRSTATDNGTAFTANSTFGSITLAESSQLAGIAWMTLTSSIAGSSPSLSVLIGEINGTFEAIQRTRQDPPDLPVAASIRSDRYHFLQNQSPVWCKHFQFAINWPAENAFNELLSFTIVGQIVQEMKGS